MKTLETERLTLRPYTPEDAAFTLELMNSKPWLKYIGDRGIRTLADAENYVREKIMKSYEERGFGMFAVILKSTGKQIGSCGLVKRETLLDVDLGFAFLPGFEGKGYGYESSMAVLEFAKQDLKLERLLAITLPTNAASIGLLEKLGFSFEKMTRLEGDDEELRMYGIKL